MAVSPGSPIAVVADEERRYYATQLHMDVAHTPQGATLIANFATRNVSYNSVDRRGAWDTELKT